MVVFLLEVDVMDNVEVEFIELDIFYEDEDLVVINKFVVMVVYFFKGYLKGMFVVGLVYYFCLFSGLGGEVWFGIVYCFDWDIIGVILIVKMDFVYEYLV